MKKKCCLWSVVCCLVFLLPISIFGQLVIRISALPASTPAGTGIYLAGTVNNWQAASAAYRLQPDASGIFQISLDIPAGTVQFKFTRGSWETVEGGAGGGFLPNRSLEYRGGRQVETVSIQSWEDLDRSDRPKGTAAPNVQILSSAFYMPQLNRQRRIWIYLPPDYGQSQRRYPVLYLHDGQNLFDASQSFSGEWQVDETLNRLAAAGDGGAIVVGIDNGGASRINEYAAWPNSRYGGGEGAAYAEFIVKTLKPFVDQQYRTLSDQANTGIMGSSMGGLISLYAAVAYPEVFGRVGILSPSLWFTREAYTQLLRENRPSSQKIYLMAGRREGAGVVEDVYALANTMYQDAYDMKKVFLISHADGQHSEWYWAREFGDVYRWLFSDWPESEQPDPLPRTYLSLSGKPGNYRIRAVTPNSSVQVVLTAASGEELLRLSNVGKNSTRLPALPAGTYFAYLYSGEQLLCAQRLQFGASPQLEKKLESSSRNSSGN